MSDVEKLDWCGYAKVILLKICLFILIEYTNVRDGQTDSARRHGSAYAKIVEQCTPDRITRYTSKHVGQISLWACLELHYEVNSSPIRYYAQN